MNGGCMTILARGRTMLQKGCEVKCQGSREGCCVPEASSRQFGNPPLIFRNLVPSLLNFPLSGGTLLLSKLSVGMLRACPKLVWSDRALGHRHKLQSLSRRPPTRNLSSSRFHRFQVHLAFRIIGGQPPIPYSKAVLSPE